MHLNNAAVLYHDCGVAGYKVEVERRLFQQEISGIVGDFAGIQVRAVDEKKVS